MELRASMGLTRKEFAEILKCSYQSIYQWENGTIEPGSEMIVRLNEIAGTNGKSEEKKSQEETPKVDSPKKDDPPPSPKSIQKEKQKKILQYERITQTVIIDLIDEINIMAKRGYRLIQIIPGIPHHAIMERKTESG